MQQIATLVFIAGISGLFYLDRDRKARASLLLWVAVLWMMIAGSRNVGEWLSLQEPVSQDAAYLEGNPVDRTALGALELIAVIGLVLRRQRVAAILRGNVPILMYFGYCLLTVMWADYPLVGLKRWFRAFGDVLIVLVVLTDSAWLPAIKRLFARVGFVLIPVSILFIRYIPDLGRAYGSSDGTMYWTGVSTGKNGLGVICQIFGVASLWRLVLALRDRQDPNRNRLILAHSSLLVMALYLLYEANSMTSVACFVLASSVMLAATLKMTVRWPVLIHLLVTAVVLCSFATLFLNMGGSALKTLGRDPTLTGRTDVWQMVLPFAVNPVFGAGYESFWLGERLRKIHELNPGINQAHNGYIEVYLNMGWIGVSLILGIVVTGYRKIVSGLRREPDVGALRLAFFVVGVIYNFTEAGIKMMHPVWIAFLMAIAMVPRLHSSNRPAGGSGTVRGVHMNLSWANLVPATIEKDSV